MPGRPARSVTPTRAGPRPIVQLTSGSPRSHPGSITSAAVSGRRFLLVFLLLAAVHVAVVPVALSSDATAPSKYRILPGDARRFHKIASFEGRPYRDFEVEYPPVMVAAIEVIDGGSFRSTTVRLMWSQLVVDLAIAAVVAWGWGRRAGIAYLVLGLPFLLYPFLYLRLDLLSVFLAVLGIALVRRRHQYAGGAALAIACFAKLWPVVLIPVLVVRRHRRPCAGADVSWRQGMGVREHRRRPRAEHRRRDAPHRGGRVAGRRGDERRQRPSPARPGRERVGRVDPCGAGEAPGHGRARRPRADGRDQRLPRVLAPALAAVPAVAAPVHRDRGCAR